jgi:hypothetical protein
MHGIVQLWYYNTGLSLSSGLVRSMAERGGPPAHPRAPQGRTLNGEGPDDFPAARPTKFELAINAQTPARRVLRVPRRCSQFADEVIE